MSTELLHPDLSGPGAPSLTFFPASCPNGTGVLICPGGAYTALATGHEGDDIAAFLNERGYDAWLLRYRVASHFPTPLLLQPLEDARRALQRIHASARVNKVGVWGFSAGGHLAATLATHSSVEERVDFAILAYPVIDLRPPVTHSTSRFNLVGEDESLATQLSAHLNITPQTPPTFLFHTTDDASVPVENSLQFFAALRRHGVSAELHIYETGSHGVGLAPDNPALRSWGDQLENWLGRR